MHGTTRYCSEMGAQFGSNPSAALGVQVCHRRFFFFKSSFRTRPQGTSYRFSLFYMMSCAVGASRDVLLKTVTKFPAGGVPNDVKGKTVVMKLPVTSVQN